MRYAYTAALGLGLGDSLFNIQIYAALAQMFEAKEVVAAFSVFNLLQNIGSAVGKKRWKIARF